MDFNEIKHFMSHVTSRLTSSPERRAFSHATRLVPFYPINLITVTKKKESSSFYVERYRQGLIND
jgi:hypothetical protein